MSLLCLFDSNQGKAQGKRPIERIRSEIRSRPDYREMWSFSLEAFEGFYRENYNIYYDDQDKVLVKNLNTSLNENTEPPIFRVKDIKKRD